MGGRVIYGARRGTGRGRVFRQRWTSTTAKTHVRDPPLCTSIDGSIRPSRGIRRPQPASRPECGKALPDRRLSFLRRNFRPGAPGDRPAHDPPPPASPGPPGPGFMATYLIALSVRSRTGIARTNRECHRAAQHIFYSCPCNVETLKSRRPDDTGRQFAGEWSCGAAGRVFLDAQLPATSFRSSNYRQPGGPKHHSRRYRVLCRSAGPPKLRT